MINFAITSLITIFFIVNPLGATPVFLALTERETARSIRKIVKRAVLTMVGVLLLFTLLGHHILAVFHLSIYAIRISGGIILFMMAMNMIQAERVKGKSRREEESEAKHKSDISIVPLGLPMLAGPGSITTILVLTSQHKGVGENLIIMMSIIATGVFTYFILTRAAQLLHILGRTGINIFTRLMGLMLAALAVQYILNGIAGALPELTKNLPGHF